MRLLHVISGLGTGGAESFLATLAPRLMALGYEQRVVSLTGHGPLSQRIEAAGIPVDALDVRGLIRAPRAIVRLASLIRTFDPAIVQGWMYHGDLLATLASALAGRNQTRRLIWNIRCSDMRLEDYALQLRLTVRACAGLSGRPDIVLANSAAGLDVHRRAGYHPRAIEIIPNGVDTMRFKPDAAARAAVRADLGIALDVVVVVHVARVDPMKDHATMIAAAGSITAGGKTGNAVVVLVGAGTEVLGRGASLLGLGRRADVERLLAAADIVASSSAYGEGFSNAIAEGMAAGCVPVATDVGDARAIVGETGVIVPPRDPTALADALSGLIALRPGGLAAHGQAARQRVVDRFALETAAQRYSDLYTRMAATGGQVQQSAARITA